MGRHVSQESLARSFVRWMYDVLGYRGQFTSSSASSGWRPVVRAVFSVFLGFRSDVDAGGNISDNCERNDDARLCDQRSGGCLYHAAHENTGYAIVQINGARPSTNLSRIQKSNIVVARARVCLLVDSTLGWKREYFSSDRRDSALLRLTTKRTRATLYHYTYISKYTP